MTSATPYPDHFFDKQDASDDALFYSFPRKVVHIDDHAIGRVRDLYAELLPPGGRYLDLMSSWRSHLPDSLRAAHVTGLGMNAEEMAENPQLATHIVQNLNQRPTLPFEDAGFDAAMCCVSVQYLQQPVKVFSEVSRVLKPGAPFVVTFSNRCFPSKAVRAWLTSSDAQHVALVASYFEAAEHWTGIDSRAYTPTHADPLYAVWGYRAR